MQARTNFGRGILFVSMVGSISGALGCSSEAVSSGSGSAPEGPASYYRDIAPLVEAKCNNCHVEGGIAPFAFSTYEELKALAPAVKAAVTSKSMPPWPASDTCNDYLGDRSLTDDQISRLVGWIDEGMQEGNPLDAPVKVDSNQLSLSRVD